MMVEPQTKTKFEDEFDMKVYPGLNKTYPHGLVKLSIPTQEFSVSLAYFAQKFMQKPFVVGQYTSQTVSLYRMKFLTALSGTELMRVIKPGLMQCSQSKYNTEFDSTRTGSLFYKSVTTLRINKGDEVIFLCNHETKNLTIWVYTCLDRETKMHFTIESQLLNDIIDFAFGDDQSPVIETTYKPE